MNYEDLCVFVEGAMVNTKKKYPYSLSLQILDGFMAYRVGRVLPPVKDRNVFLQFCAEFDDYFLSKGYRIDVFRTTFDKTVLLYKEDEKANKTAQTVFKTILFDEQEKTVHEILAMAMVYCSIKFSLIYENNADLKTVLDRLSKVSVSKERSGKLDKGMQILGFNCDTHSLSEIALFYNKLQKKLQKKVLGQDKAISVVVKALEQSDMFPKNTDGDSRKQLTASFFFAGPSGCGKTLLAESLAEYLNRPYLRLDMAMYADEKSHIDLIGSSTRFKGGEEGVLTGFVDKNPSAVILLDEIEKAHDNTMRILLSVLDGARLRSENQNKDIDFSKTIIICTTNAGKNIYENSEQNLNNISKSTVIKALRNDKNEKTDKPFFSPEFLSRIASMDVVVFNHISVETTVRIVRNSLKEICDKIAKERRLKIDYDDRLPYLFLWQYGSQIDARIAARQSKKFITEELDELIQWTINDDEMFNGVDSIKIDIDIEPDKKDIKELFAVSSKAKVLVIADEKIREAMPANRSIKYLYADTLEEAVKLIDEDIDIVLIDPWYKMSSNGINSIGINDRKSVGIDLIRRLDSDKVDMSTYLILGEKDLTDVDRSAFLLWGVRDFIPAYDDSIKNLGKEILNLVRNYNLQKKYNELSRKGVVVSFETAQIPKEKNGTTLGIRIFNIERKISYDVEDSELIVADLERPDITFDDVIGEEMAKRELRYFMDFFKNPKKYMLQGAKPPKGIILHGEPGTGKTMLAKALAGETGFTFISTTGTELLNGRTAGIKKYFSLARKYSPAILFIDEIDTIAKERTGYQPIMEECVNTLLTEMEGFHEHKNAHVLVIAATNFPIEKNPDEEKMVLDEALVRRFDRAIYVELPDMEERTQFISLMLKQYPGCKLSAKDKTQLAKRTIGCSPDRIQHVFDLAFRKSVSETDKPFNYSTLDEAYEEITYGEKKTYPDEVVKRTAIHESGHAYINFLQGKIPTYVTVVAAGSHLGYEQYSGDENKPCFTKEELEAEIRVALAGRAAEQVFLGKDASLNTGTRGDLAQASYLAYRMVMEYGMVGDSLLALNFEKVGLSPDKNKLGEIEKVLNTQMDRCIEEIEAGKAKMKKLIDALMKKNKLVEADIVTILK